MDLLPANSWTTDRKMAIYGVFPVVSTNDTRGKSGSHR